MMQLNKTSFDFNCDLTLVIEVKSDSLTKDTFELLCNFLKEKSELF